VQSFLELRDLPVRYIFAGRPGKSAALNEALAQTEGEYVGLSTMMSSLILHGSKLPTRVHRSSVG